MDDKPRVRPDALRHIALAPALMLLACLFSASLGVAQNQLTYMISPSWYHEWKFVQFAIPDQFHGRTGATLVGVHATWWMGLILSPFLLVPSLFASTAKRTASIFVLGALGVLVITLLGETGAFLWGLVAFGDDNVPEWAWSFDEPVAAARVQLINFVGYCSSAAGTIAATIWASLQVARSPDED